MSVGERIRQRRQELGWSQARLAAEACRRAGVGLEALGRQEMYRYEKGRRTPREWLPFIAQALQLSVEELTALESSADGLSLVGVWHSRYTYESTGRGSVTRHHFVVVRQTGDRLTAESLPGSNDSPVSLELTLRGTVATGTWTEQTAAAGYYQGAVYHGALQLLVDLTGRRMVGKWVGFGKGFEVDTGPWELDFKDGSTEATILGQYDRSPIPE
ncbi:helix-turn-helix transcriptional regulator [Streptacidiphilus sp. EB103A]|uniref:helix-turn-helix transcriptional regulator n=1 Tax=Streptacidiphilus sp. EB103A TaxID=3156275 RepID=UPI003511E6F8